MSSDISTVPFNDQPGSFAWLEWFRQVREHANARNRHGCFNKTGTQTYPLANTAYPVSYDNTLYSDGIVLMDDGYTITIPRTGLYRIDFSAQVSSTSAGQKNVWFWPQVNGQDVEGYTMKQTVTNNLDTNVISRSGAFHMNAGDLLVVYTASDSTNMQIAAEAATGFSPTCPASTISLCQVG